MMSDATCWFMRLNVLILVIVKPSFTICVDAPTIEDSCYARALQAAGLSWSPPRSCGAVNEYEVLYTQSTCNASDSTLPHGAQNNETNVILTSSETYCIRVRAVINGSFYSNFSTCAEVASLEEDRLSNVMMHGDLCIPATLCHHNRHPSKIILSNTQELLHLTWRALEARRNVNRTYSSTTDTNMFCFRNVTESFLFLEYCEEGRMPCVKDTRFCCNWLEFVARTCVNVNGSGRCSDLLKPSLTPSRVISSSVPADTSFITSTSSVLPCTATTVVISNISIAVMNTPPGDNSVAVTIATSIVVPLIVLIGIFIVTVICIWYHKYRKPLRDKTNYS